MRFDGLEKYGIRVSDGKVKTNIKVSYMEMPNKLYRHYVYYLLDLEDQVHTYKQLLLALSMELRKAAMEAELNRELIGRLESELSTILPRYAHMLKSNRHLRSRIEEVQTEAYTKEELLKTYEDIINKLVDTIRKSDVFVDINQAVEVARRAVRSER